MFDLQQTSISNFVHRQQSGSSWCNKRTNIQITRSVAARFGRHGMPRRPLMTQVQHWAKMAQTDHVTLPSLTFDLGGHGACGWSGSSSSIYIPSLKFVGLAIRKIWRTMCVSINGPGDLDLRPLTLKLVCESHQRWGTFIQNLVTLALWFSNYSLCARQTDGRTDKSNAYHPLPFGRGHNNNNMLDCWVICCGQDVKKHCWSALADIGATNEVCQVFGSQIIGQQT